MCSCAAKSMPSSLSLFFFFFKVSFWVFFRVFVLFCAFFVTRANMMVSAPALVRLFSSCAYLKLFMILRVSFHPIHRRPLSTFA